MNLNELTTDAVMALNPCPDYPREKVQALIKRLATETPFEVLSSIPVEDAYWFLSKALSVLTRVRWAEACAERARGYADAANYAARYDSRNAEYAAAAGAATHYARYATIYVRRAISFSRYAADAAHYAEYAARAAKYADASAEQRLAVEHSVSLLGAE